jgi:hypothetical protein
VWGLLAEWLTVSQFDTCVDTLGSSGVLYGIAWKLPTVGPSAVAWLMPVFGFEVSDVIFMRFPMAFVMEQRNHKQRRGPHTDQRSGLSDCSTAGRVAYKAICSARVSKAAVATTRKLIVA